MVYSASTVLALASAVVGLVYLFLTWSFGYWKRKGIKEAKSYPLIGSFPSLFTQKHHLAYDIEQIYRKYRGKENFVGVFAAKKPQLIILNPEIAHKVLVNDFKSFHDNEFANFVDEKKDLIFGNNPFAIKGELWKERRNQVTPGLTSNRIKNSYPVTQETCAKFKNFIDQQIKVPSRDGIDTIELALRFTCEVTTDCVLGVKANSLGGVPTPILEKIKSIFDVSYKILIYQMIVGLLPGLEKFYKVAIFPKHAEVFFSDLMKQAIELRQKEKSDRVDFLNYLLQLQEKKNMSNGLLTAHSMTFLTDGFFTTAIAVSHTLLLLARFPETQKKLREEILNNLQADGSVDFEKLHELPYLDACFHETLRMFSPLQFANKLCTAPYEMENKDGTKLKLTPGDVVILPVNSIHLDEKYYESPNVYKPERYLIPDGVKSFREKGLFYGFGDGPRSCLGMRFALTQGKAAIVEVVKNFQVTVNPKTRSDNHLDPKQFIGMLDGGIYLDFAALK